MYPAKIRVLVVDDSILFRQVLSKGLGNDPGIEVIASSADPIDAMEKITALRPDVVTLDVEMPKMNGIEFLKRLMPVRPLPVVVVSSLPINALDALDAGAVDFVRKPRVQGPSDVAMFINELASKVKIASHAHVGMKRPVASVPLKPVSLVNRLDGFVIAIGASTGGTEAILEVIRNLPATTPGILVVQHMPPVFTQMYAQRLDKLCQMRVKEAQHLDRLERGQVLLGAGEFHLRLAKDARGFYVKSERGDKVSGHCPSVDVLFDSVAEVAGRKSIGVLLTGMGADGAKGLLKMRQRGAYTIGQDKESSVVYGMPMVAFNIGGVAKQLPLESIQSDLIRALNSFH